MARLPLPHRGRRRNASSSLGRAKSGRHRPLFLSFSCHLRAKYTNRGTKRTNVSVHSVRRWHRHVVTLQGRHSEILLEEMSASTRAGGGPPPKNALLVALADALAGAIGSVVAVVVFYPMDTAKTRAQALYGESP